MQLGPIDSMLGFSRFQRRRVRRNREPAPKMHGRPSPSTSSREHDQLPLGPDAEIRYQPAEEEEIKKQITKMEDWREVHIEEWANGLVRFLLSTIRMRSTRIYTASEGLDTKREELYSSKERMNLMHIKPHATTSVFDDTERRAGEKQTGQNIHRRWLPL
jgi:hypothetical protein